MVPNFDLKPTQKILFDQLVSHLNEFSNTSLIATTGIGKTVMAAHFAAEAIKILNPDVDVSKDSAAWQHIEGCHQVIFIVHRDKLVYQTYQRFVDVFKSRFYNNRNVDEFGIWDGITIIKGRESYFPSKPIVIASVQTLVRRLDEYVSGKQIRPTFVFFDEAHTTSFSEVGRRIINSGLCKKRMALTGSPFRLDKKQWFGMLWDHAVCSPNGAYLMDKGELCPVKYFSFNTERCTDGIKKSRAGFFNDDELTIRFNTNENIEYAIGKWESLESRNMKTICFVCSVIHGEAVEEAFKNKGYRAQLINYKTKDKEREQIYSDFAEGEIQILISIFALTEGFDEQTVQCCLDMAPTTSYALHWQKYGRVFRPHFTKEYCLILDMVGNIDRMGDFGCPEIVTLTEEIVLRQENISERTGEAPIKFCHDDKFGEGCGAGNHAAARMCCDCGKEFELKPKGELKELSGEMIRVIRPKMIKNEKSAILFYRSLRLKKWINDKSDPQAAYYDYISLEDISEKYPIPSPYKRPFEHRKWTLGSITNNPDSLDKGIIFMSQLKTMSKGKRNPKNFVKLNLMLEFNDVVFNQLWEEYENERRERVNSLFR